MATEYEHENNSKPGSRHGWWEQHCDHCNKTTPHLSVLGGECANCQDERRENKETNHETVF